MAIRWLAVLPVLLIANLAFAGFANADSIVSPHSYTNTEAPFRTGSFPPRSRAMSIYSASEFVDVPDGGIFLTWFNLRPDMTMKAGDQIGFGNYKLVFSVTPIEPLDMSKTFDENFTEGVPREVVYATEWLAAANNRDPFDRVLWAFDYRTPLQKPFFYNPANGNLLVEWYFEDPLANGRFDRSFADGGVETQTTMWGNGLDAEIASIDFFTVVTEFIYAIPGDFDNDNVLGVTDIDILSDAIRSETDDSPLFDVNIDGSIDHNDHSHWVRDLKNTWFGDANLDGEFNSGDLVSVFSAGKYGTGQPASWSEGDWDGSGEFNSGDLVAAFTDGGYDKGFKAAATGVPEPSSCPIFIPILLGIAVRRMKTFQDEIRQGLI